MGGKWEKKGWMGRWATVNSTMYAVLDKTAVHWLKLTAVQL